MARRIPLLAMIAAIGLVVLVIAVPAQATAPLFNTGAAPNCCGSGSDWFDFAFQVF